MNAEGDGRDKGPRGSGMDFFFSARAAWIGGAFGFLNDLTSRSKETTGGGGWWSDGWIASFIMDHFENG